MNRNRLYKLLITLIVGFLGFIGTASAEGGWVTDPEQCYGHEELALTFHFFVDGVEVQPGDPNAGSWFGVYSSKRNPCYSYSVPEGYFNYNTGFGSSQKRFTNVDGTRGVIYWYDNPELEGSPVVDIYKGEYPEDRQVYLYAKTGPIIEIYANGFKKKVVVGRMYSPYVLEPDYSVSTGVTHYGNEHVNYWNYSTEADYFTYSSNYREGNSNPTYTYYRDRTSTTGRSSIIPAHAYYTHVDNTELVQFVNYASCRGNDDYLYCDVADPETGEAMTVQEVRERLNDEYATNIVRIHDYKRIPKYYKYFGFIDTEGREYPPEFEMKEEYAGRAFTTVVDGKMSCATNNIYPYDSYDEPAKLFNTTIDFDGAIFSGDFNTNYQTKLKSYYSNEYWDDDKTHYQYSTCVPYDLNFKYTYKISNPNIRQYMVVIEGQDGVRVNRNSVYTLPMEGKNKGNEVTVVTLKYQDGETSDEQLVYTKTYTPSGFKIDGVHYDFGQEIVVTRDLFITYDYTEELTGPDLPTPTRENYSFKGWYDATIGGHLITDARSLAARILYAQWNDKDRVTIVRPDGIPIELERGSEYTMPAIWDKDEIINSKVSFNYNDRSGRVDVSEVITSYKRDGIIDSLTGEKYAEGQKIIVNDNMVLNANWIETVKPARFPTNMTRNGYEFAGWFDAVQDGTQYTEYAGDVDLNLFARWEGDVQQIYIYYPDGFVDTIDLGESYTLPRVLTINDKYNVTFKYQDDETSDKVLQVVHSYLGNGWYIDGVLYPGGSTITPIEDVYLTSDYVEAYTYPVFPEVEDKEWYTFEGWYDEAEEGVQFTSYEELAEKTFYAHWKEIPFKDITLGEVPAKANENGAAITFIYNDNVHEDEIRYVTKTFRAAGWLVDGLQYNTGDEVRITRLSTMEPQYIESITSVSFPEDPVRLDYSFLGWYDAEEEGTKYTSYNGNNNITLYAHWHENDRPYNLGFNTETRPNVDLATVTFDYHSNFSNVTSKVYRYYVANGWLVNGVHYSDNTIIYRKNDTVIEPYFEERIHQAEFPTVFTLTAFEGWYTQQEGGELVTSYAGTEDITLHAHYANVPAREEMSAFTRGSYFRSKIIALAGGENNIYYIRRSSTPPDASIMDDDHDVSTTERSTFAGGPKIYAWYDNNTIYWWTESEKAYLHYESSAMFSLRKLKEFSFDDYEATYVRNASSMFSSDGDLETLDLSHFNGYHVDTFNSFLQGCQKLQNVDVSNLYTAQATDMAYMFYNTKINSLDVSNFNTSRVTDIEYMFASNPNITSLNLSNFDTKNVTSMRYLFYGDTSLTNLDLSTFDTSKVQDLSGMFNNCRSLQSVNLSSFNTTNATNIANMFNNCSSLQAIDVSNFNTGNTTNISGMFAGTSSLSSLDLTGFNTNNMGYMGSLFNGSGITSIDLSNFNTSKVANFSYMFSRTPNLSELDLSSFDTSLATDMGDMFSYSGVSNLNISSFDTSNVQKFTNMFYSAKNLEELDISSFDTSAATNTGSMFGNMTSIKTIYASDKFDLSNMSSSGQSMFYGDTQIVGQKGTTYDGSYTDKTYAIIDNAPTAPGYFSLKFDDQEFTITYPDGTTETKHGGETFVFPRNLSSKDSEVIATVTFVYNNGTPNTTSNVIKNYVASGWLVDGVHYSEDDELVITQDITLAYNYVVTTVGAAFPETPTYSGYEFVGWFTENDGGEKVLGYFEDHDTTLYAHWTDDVGVTATLTVPGDFRTAVISANATNTSTEYKSFRKATQAEYETALPSFNETNIVSTDDSDVPIYLWRIDDDIVYYSTADTIYLNPSCYQMFAILHTIDGTDNFPMFESIDISGLDASKATTMAGMFNEQEYLININLGEFNTENVRSFTKTFYGLKNITSIDLGNINTRAAVNMSSMFGYAMKLESIDLSKIQTESVTDMSEMFYNNKALTEIDLSGFYTPVLNTISRMFYGDNNLATIYASEYWDASNTKTYGVFEYNPVLVGGNGTTYSSDHRDYTYAVIDTPETPGYFTYKAWSGNMVQYKMILPDRIDYVLYGETYTIPENNYGKNNSLLSTVTFDPQNGDPTTSANVEKQYIPNNWLINGISYNNGDTIVVTRDYILNPNYTEVGIPATYPEDPIKVDYEFIGWFTDSENGEQMDSYNGANDITLYAHYRLAGNAEPYILPVNNTPKEGGTYTVTFDPQNGGATTTSNLVIAYIPNGWLVDGIHYDDGDEILKRPSTVIVEDYTIDITPPTYPADPTKDGKVFTGWFDAINGGTRYDDYTEPRDITLYAHYNYPGEYDYYPLLCKRAETLHTSTCYGNTSANYCWKSYANNATITYGQLGSLGELHTGDAFDCDVNHDGVFNAANERFYYISDYYNPNTNEFDSDYASLVYYSTVVNGSPNAKSQIKWSVNADSYNGPSSAYTYLPTTSQWNNVTLKEPVRQMRTIDGSTTGYNGQALGQFDYSSRAARMLTDQELVAGCTPNHTTDFSLSRSANSPCEFLLERTDYSNNWSGYTKHYWMESIWIESSATSNQNKIKLINTERARTGWGTYSTNTYGVRPVIDVPKDRMEIDTIEKTWYYVNFPDYQEHVESGTEYTLPVNSYEKEEEPVATITFDYRDGHTPIQYRSFSTHFIPAGWTIDDVHYDDGAIITVNRDLNVVPDYSTYQNLTITFPDDPNYENRLFLGWYDAPEGGNRYTSYSLHEDLTLYAQYSYEEFVLPSYNTYSVYNNRGTITYKYNDGVTADKSYIQYELIFQDGYMDPVTNILYDAGSVVTKDIYDRIEPHYTFMDRTNTLPTTPTREGYTFLGWFLEDGEKLTSNTIVYGDHIANAAWAETIDGKYYVLYPDLTVEYVDPGTIVTLEEYTNYQDDLLAIVTFNYNDGVTPDYIKEIHRIKTNNGFTANGIVHDFGSDVVVNENMVLLYNTIVVTDASFPSNPTRDGYTFLGWYSTANGGKKYTSYLSHQDITLYANWKDDSYVEPVEPEVTYLCKRTNSLHNYSTMIISEEYGNYDYTSGQLVAGDAFDCDVNGDGIYDPETERFYYVSDYYDTSKKEFDSNYAAMIYYANYNVDTPVLITDKDVTVKYNSSNVIYNGPDAAIQLLPDKTLWKNTKLRYTRRDIIEADGSNSDNGFGYLKKFNYGTKAARFLTKQEVDAAKGDAYSYDYTTSFLFENTITADENGGWCDEDPEGCISSDTHYYYLETPYSYNRFTAMGAEYSSWSYEFEDTSLTSSYLVGVRPVIDVYKALIEDAGDFTDNVLITLDDLQYIVKKGSVFVLPEGHSGGDVDGTITATFHYEDGITQNLQVTAHKLMGFDAWNIAGVSYKAGTPIVVNNDITGTAEYDVSSEDISFPMDPTRTSYNFLGWFDSNDVQYTSYAGNEDVDLYAHWEVKEPVPGEDYVLPTNNQTKDPIEFTVTFEPQNGDDAIIRTVAQEFIPSGWLVNGEVVSDNTTIHVEVETTIEPNYVRITVGTFPEDPVKTDWTFDGWYNAVSGGDKYNVSDIDKDMTLYAHYIDNRPPHEPPEGTKCIRAQTLDVDPYYGMVYGSTGEDGVLNVSDAFMCDTDGNGTFDRKFYYISDYYDTETKEFNHDYAVLLDSGYSSWDFYDYSNNYNGPTQAVTNLPTTSEWTNFTLYKDHRNILTVEGNNSFNNVNLPTNFSYEGKAARFLTIQEYNAGCGQNITSALINGHSLISIPDVCSFVMDGLVEYEPGPDAPSPMFEHFMLESIIENNNGEYVTLVHDGDYVGTGNGRAIIKSVIEVEKDKLDLAVVPIMHNITYPNGRVDTVESGSSYTFATNNGTKASQVLATVTFKLQNGQEDLTSKVLKVFTADGWNSGYIHSGETRTIWEDITLYAYYKPTTQVATFPPNPVKDGYMFMGWYDQPTGGNAVTSYSGTTDKTLYAHYVKVDNEGKVTLGKNDTPKSDVILSDVHFYTAYEEWDEMLGDYYTYENHVADTTIKKQYIPNGWLVDGVHYNDYDKILLTPTSTIVPDYKEFIVPGTFPRDPEDPEGNDSEFIGWYDSYSNYGNEVTVLNNPTSRHMYLYAKFTSDYALLKQGVDVRSVVSSAAYQKSNVSFRKATQSEYNAVKSALNINNRISDNSSPKEAYAWYDSTSNSVLFYSEAEVIFMNPDSQKMFFDGVNIVNYNLAGLNAIKVTNMYRMFFNDSKAETIDFANLNTSHVTNMSELFNNDENLTTVNISNLNTSNVTDMSNMFGKCSSLESIDVSSFDTRNVTNMYRMFYFNTALESLDLSKFDTSSVTNMSGMFISDHNITSLDLTNFNTSNVTNMSQLFKESGITDVKLDHFDTRNVTNMYEMFAGIPATELNLSSFDTSSLTDAGWMFNNDPQLTTIYVSEKWTNQNITSSTNMFYNDSSLVGQEGTTYSYAYVNSEYARIDAPEKDEPGYLTYKGVSKFGIYIDGTKVKTVEIGEIYTIPDYPEATIEPISTVTFVYDNGSNPTTSTVNRLTRVNEYNIGNTKYAPGDYITVEQDVYITTKSVTSIVGATFPSDPTKEGYSFTGWMTPDGNTVLSYDGEDDITLTANWLFSSTQYVVTYDDGEVVIYTEETDITVPDKLYSANKSLSFDYQDGVTPIETVTFKPYKHITKYKVDIPGNPDLTNDYVPGQAIHVNRSMSIIREYDSVDYDGSFPTNNNEGFIGWFTSTTGGKMYTNYKDYAFDKIDDNPLYARYEAEGKASVVLDGVIVTELNIGETYTFPEGTNYDKDISTVTFVEKNKTTEKKVHVTKEFDYFDVEGTTYHKDDTIVANSTIYITSKYKNEVRVPVTIEDGDDLDYYLFEGWYKKSNNELPVATEEGLVDYFDYTSYDGTRWGNMYGTDDMSITGAITLENDSVHIDRQSGVNYASIPIDNTTDTTIYFVAKSQETGGSGNNRFIDIHSVEGALNTKIPHVYSNNNKIGFSTHGVPINTNISALDYHVIAVTLSNGMMKLYVDGNYIDQQAYTEYGSTLYLSACNSSSTAYGNNNFKALAIYNNANEDYQVLATSTMMKSRYIDENDNWRQRTALGQKVTGTYDGDEDLTLYANYIPKSTTINIKTDDEELITTKNAYYDEEVDFSDLALEEEVGNHMIYYDFQNGIETDNYATPITYSRIIDHFEDDYSTEYALVHTVDYIGTKNLYPVYGEGSKVDITLDNDDIGYRRAGYNFDGWYTQPAGGSLITKVTKDEDTYVYAHWSKIPGLQTCEDSDGNTWLCNPGDTITVPEEGYKELARIDMYINGDGEYTTSIYNSGYVVKNYTVDYYEMNGTKYYPGNTITIGNDELTQINIVTSSEEVVPYYPEDIDTVESYWFSDNKSRTFTGWFTRATGGDQIFKYAGDKNLYLFAHYKETLPDEETYTVTIEYLDGTKVTQDNVSRGTKIKLQADQYVNSNHTTKLYDNDGTTLIGTANVKFTHNADKYLVNTELVNVGSEVTIVKDTIIKAYETSSSKEINGYIEPTNNTFIGYFTQTTGGDKFNINDVKESDNVISKVYAHYHEAPAEGYVSVDFDGDITNVLLGTEINLPSNKTKAGNSYNVVFNFNQAAYTSYTATVSTTYTLTGYKVNDVDYEANTSVTADTNLVIRSQFGYTSDYDQNTKINYNAEYPNLPTFSYLTLQPTSWVKNYEDNEVVSDLTNINDNIELYAKYGDTAKVYLDDVVIAEVAVGSIYTLPTNTINKASDAVATVTFNHNDDNDTVTTSNVFKAYTPNGWTVEQTEYTSGANITVNNDITLIPRYKETILAAKFPRDPSKEMATFNGWYDTLEDGGTKYTTYNGTSDLTLYGKYTKKVKIVDPNTGETEIVDEGTVITLQSLSDKDEKFFNITFKYNYEGCPSDKVVRISTQEKFVGWLINGVLHQAGDEITVNEDITKVASYETVVNNKNLPNDPTRDGYTFKGWYNSASDLFGTAVDVTKLTTSATVYAHWDEFDPLTQVKLTWDGKVTVHEKGTVINLHVDGTSYTDHVATIRFMMNKEGHDDKIYSIDKDYYIDHLVINGENHADSGEYTLNEDTVITSVYANNVTYPSIPVISDSTFKGFYTTPNGGTKVTSIEGIVTDKTFYARWETETVHIEIDGEEDDVPKGTEITLKPGNTKESDMITVILKYDDELNRTFLFTTSYTFDHYEVNGTTMYPGQKYKADTNVNIVSIYNEETTNTFTGLYNNNWDIGGFHGELGYITGWYDGDTLVDLDTLSGKSSDYDNTVLEAEYKMSGTVNVYIDSMDPYTENLGKHQLIKEGVTPVLDVPQGDSFNVTYDYNDNIHAATVVSVSRSYTFSHYTADGKGEYQANSLYDFGKDTYIRSQYNVAYTYPGEPTNDNSRFLGWFTEPVYGSQVSINDITEETTVYAHYKNNQSQAGIITFDGEEYIVNPGTDNVTPINEGYGANQVVKKFTLTLVYKDDAIKRIFSATLDHIGWVDENGNEYGETIDLTANGVGEVFTSRYDDSNVDPVSLSQYNPDDDKFDGWYTQAEGGSKVTSYIPTTDETYYAHYLADNEVVITIDGEEEIHTVGESYNLPDAKTKTGPSIIITFDHNDDLDNTTIKTIDTVYTFTGYRLESDNQLYDEHHNFILEDNMTFTSEFTNSTVYPEWPADPTKEHFVFVGWYSAKTTGVQVFNYDDISSNTTLYAHYVRDDESFIKLTNTVTGEYIQILSGSDFVFAGSKFNKTRDKLYGNVTFKFNAEGYPDEIVPFKVTHTPSGFHVNGDTTTLYTMTDAYQFTEDTNITPYYNEEDDVFNSHIGPDIFDYELKKDNHSVICFSKSNNETYTCYNEYIKTDGDITLYAHWGENKTIIIPGEDPIVGPTGGIVTLPDNTKSKDSDLLATVTFKYHDDVTADTTSTVERVYTPNGWIIDGVHYDNGASYTISDNQTAVEDYTSEIVGATFPTNPTRDNYNFQGWYDNDEYTGDTYTTYSESSNITLHAKWTGVPIQVCVGDDCIDVSYGSTRNIGVNDTEKADTDVATVTFKYHDDVTDDTISKVTKSYTPSGWLVNGETVADNTEITITENTTIEKNYIEVINGATFPSTPTRENYGFAGWYDNTEGTGDAYTTYAGTQDITLHATWLGNNVPVCIGDNCTDVPYGSTFTFGTNDIPKADADVATVTFKYHDDVTADTTSNVVRRYTPNGWIVGDTHYENGETIIITQSIDYEPDYTYELISATFPNDPTRTNYIFDGWYDNENKEGEPYTTYTGTQNITLHANWTGEPIQVCIGDDCHEVPYGTEKNLGVNDEPKETDNIATVTFNPHNDEDLIIRYVTRSYVPSGWKIGDTHYDDNATITIEGPIQIDRDYIGTVNGVEFPDDPTLDNHTFEGWFDAEEDGTQYTSYAEEQDITLHAQYSIDGPTDIELEVDSILMVVGTTRQINVSTLPIGLQVEYDYTGYSDIINIDDTGVITAVSAGETTVRVTVKNNPDIYKDLTVNVVGNLITSQAYDVTSKDLTGEDLRIIIGADPETTIANFLTNIDNPIDYIEVYDTEGTKVTDYEGIISTAYVLKLVIEDTTYDEVIVIIRGDINKDGYVDVSDDYDLISHILYMERIEDYRVYAADLEENDGATLEDMLDSGDMYILEKYILGEITNLNEEDGE